MSRTIPPRICEILEEAVNDDVENYTVTLHDPNKKGDGHFGNLFFISLKGKTNGKQFELVVKEAFSEESVRKDHPIRELFINEINLYTKVWPNFLKFQEIVSPEYRFVHLPKCFATISDDNSERLVIENLKYQGFVVHDKKKPLDKEMFESMFKAYGKFHAISFAYKALHPEDFSEILKEVLTVFKKFCNSSGVQHHFKQICGRALDALHPGEDDAVIKKFRHYIDDIGEIVNKSLDNGKYSVILHGDSWSNNMMFKYDDSGKLVDLRFLDFQLAGYGSPVCDLSYCLYSGASKETLDDLDHLLQVYHDSLSESLRAYGCDASDLYPLEAFRSDWKVHCQLGVIMGLSVWKTKVTSEESAVDLVEISMKKTQHGDEKFDEKTYKRRVRDILLHLHENNYIV